jgi:hypothetical protein
MIFLEQELKKKIENKMAAEINIRPLLKIFGAFILLESLFEN